MSIHERSPRRWRVPGHLEWGSGGTTFFHPPQTLLRSRSMKQQVPWPSPWLPESDRSMSTTQPREQLLVAPLQNGNTLSFCFQDWELRQCRCMVSICRDNIGASPLLEKFQIFLPKGIITVTDLTSQVHYKIMWGREISWYTDKYVWNTTSQNIAQTWKKIPNSLRFSTNICEHRLLPLAKMLLGFPLMSSISILVFSSSARAMCLFIFTTFLWRFCYSNKFCIISFIK